MKFNRYDKILIVLMALFNAGLFCFFGAGFNSDNWLLIKVDTERVARFLLKTNRSTKEQDFLGTTEVEVKQGKARIVCSLYRSLCELNICIKPGYIQNAGRVSACVTNKVVVRIEGGTQRGLEVFVG